MKPTQSCCKLLNLALGLLIAFLMILPLRAGEGEHAALHAENSINTTLPNAESHMEFRALARDAGIATRSEQGFAATAPGYYVVAGVFGNTDNAHRLSRQLSSKELTTKILFHPRKKLNYVVIAEHRTGLEALATAQSGVHGKYRDKTWILHVYDEDAKRNEKALHETDATGLM